MTSTKCIRENTLGATYDPNAREMELMGANPDTYTPLFGEEGEPCANGKTCNPGLKCYVSSNGLMTSTKCIRENTLGATYDPNAREMELMGANPDTYTPLFGEEGEPCANGKTCKP